MASKMTDKETTGGAGDTWIITSMLLLDINSYSYSELFLCLEYYNTCMNIKVTMARTTATSVALH